jgi:GT2 family glycosyltransferase
MATTEDPATAAVVLNWNAPALTCACLDGLLRQAPVPRLIVCDNGSDDDSISVIRAFLARHGLRVHDAAEAAAAHAGDPFAVLLPLGSNRGFAGGINPGIALALRLGAEFVWLLNNDARPEDAALAALSAHARAHPGQGLIGATVVDAAAPERIEAEAGETVEITFANEGSLSHNLTIKGLDAGTDTIQAGNTTTISFTPEEPGTYDIVCTVPGHSQAGMTGDLVVTE